MRTLYSKFNRSRLPQFQTVTTIYNENEKTYVRKKAMVKECIPHIKAMYDNYLLFKGAL